MSESNEKMLELAVTARPFEMTRVAPITVHQLKSDYHKAMLNLAPPYQKLLDNFWEMVRFMSDKCHQYVGSTQRVLHIMSKLTSMEV